VLPAGLIAPAIGARPPSGACRVCSREPSRSRSRFSFITSRLVRRSCCDAAWWRRNRRGPTAFGALGHCASAI